MLMQQLTLGAESGRLVKGILKGRKLHLEEIDDIVVDAERCWHLRMDELTRDGKPVIQRGVPYGLVINSDEPVVVQMSRLDTTQNNMAFLSTMAHGIDD